MMKNLLLSLTFLLPVTLFAERISVQITYDEWPEETSFSILDADNLSLLHHIPEGDEVDAHQTKDWQFDLNPGCYLFIIFDLYGDGICCTYGNGSYKVSNEQGTTLFTGSSFGFEATHEFCLDDDDGSDDDPDTCGDGIQNGAETGIDCGGLYCAPCASGTSPFVQNVMTHLKLTEFDEVQYRIELDNSGTRAVIGAFSPNTSTKKVYVATTNGNFIKEIFDYDDWRGGCPCRIPFVDISDDGEKILWTDGEHEIFVADFNGNNRKIIATEIEHQVDGFANFELFTHSTPRFNSSANKVYFFQNLNGTENRGLWEVGINQSLVTEQLFSYSDFDDEFVETYWDNVTSDFVGIYVSEDDEILFLTSLLDEAQYEFDVFIYKNGDYHLVDREGPNYGNEESFHFSKDGNVAVWYDRANSSKIVKKHVNSGLRKVIDMGPEYSGSAYPSKFKLNFDGSLIVVTSMSGANANSKVIVRDNGELFFPFHKHDFNNPFRHTSNVTISPHNDFLVYMIDGECWFTDLNPPTALPISYPQMAGFTMSPNWVLYQDGDSRSEFKVNVIPGTEGPVTEVSFVELSKERGPYNYLGYSGFNGNLFDDGTSYGDQSHDNTYTNNSIREVAYDILTPPDTITVRMHLWSDNRITSYDIYPFFISDSPVTSIEVNLSESEIALVPNLVRDQVRLNIQADHSGEVSWKIVNLSGQVMAYSKSQRVGNVYSESLDVSYLVNGQYYMIISSGGQQYTRTFIKL